MFNLIVAVISVALIATLAAASLFYGGEAYSEASARAEANTLITQAQQVSGAQYLHRVENTGAWEEELSDLVSEGYLQAVPEVPVSLRHLDYGWVLLDTSGDGRAYALYAMVEDGVAVCRALIAMGGVEAEMFSGVGEAPYGCQSWPQGDGSDLTDVWIRL